MASLKRYAELGRLFSGGFTTGIVLLGVFSSTGQPVLMDLLIFAIMGLFFQAYGCVINELCDKELDSSVPELSNKPLVCGEITNNGAVAYIIITLLVPVLLTGWFYPDRMAFVYLVLAFAFGGFYSLKGKYKAITYDVSLGFGFFFLVLFGAQCIGTPTPLSWVMASMVFLFEVFLQWGNAVKDVETDRKYGVPTRPVVWGYKLKHRLTYASPVVVYGLLIKLAVIATFIFPLISADIGGPSFTFVHFVVPGLPLYLLLVAGIVIPTQLLMVSKMLGRHTRRGWTTFIVKDLLLTWLITPLFLLDNLGVWIIPMMFFPLLWYVVVSLVLYRHPVVKL